MLFFDSPFLDIWEIVLSNVTVNLWGSLQQFTAGQFQLQVEAENVRDILVNLGKKYPALQSILNSGVAIAIDGQIYRDAWFQPVSQNSEIFLFPKMAGG